jgi:hypothetical protein
MSRITSNIDTITYEQQIMVRYRGFVRIFINITRTETMAPIIVSMTPAIAEITAIIPPPMAETIEP